MQRERGRFRPRFFCAWPVHVAIVNDLLFVSLFEAIVALPAHLIWGLKGTGEVARRTSRSWFDHIKAFYVGSMRYAVTLRYLVVLVAFGALAGSLWYMTTKMEFVLFPSE